MDRAALWYYWIGEEFDRSGRHDALSSPSLHWYHGMKKLTFEGARTQAASRSAGSESEISIGTNFTLVPAQFYGVLAGHRTRFESERNLMCAVLENAIKRYVSARQPLSCDKQPEMAELRRWFGERNSRHPFSFEHICEYLSLDPERIRKLLDAFAARDSLAPPRYRRTGSCARSVKLSVHRDRRPMKPSSGPHT